MRGLRAMQWVGIALVAASAFWPTVHVRRYPGQPTPGGESWLASIGAGARDIPVSVLGTAAVEAIRGPARLEPLWRSRRWYPWYLPPVWALTLILAGAAASRRRHLVGGLALLVTFGIIAFEAAYLRAEYVAFLPGAFGRIEMGCAWAFIIGVLLYRRRVDRRIGAVEATLAAQALLGFIHGVTLPATMYRQWRASWDAGEVLEAVLHNFTPAFWIGLGGLLMTALPVYLRRAAPGRTSREDGG